VRPAGRKKKSLAGNADEAFWFCNRASQGAVNFNGF